ncbi:MAG: serine/threonine protein kinase [Isosphaera sp.]|nr:serine/threonine protein kinase [Isosphaera sp.]
MPATSSAPPSPPPGYAPESPGRDAVLAAVLAPDRLPTPPAVALRVVTAAAKPDCDPAEIVTLLAQDPALCAKLLQAVNSCLYGLGKPVASLHRAVAVLGLGAVRSLALGLSLPAVRTGPADAATRAYHVSSVAGAIIARELSARTNRGTSADDLVAGLLRDLGAILLQQTFPDAWRAMVGRWGDRLLAEPCEAETETFGVSHAEVSAELLRRWHLPDDVVEPIRHHHHPERLAVAPDGYARRAELLYFAGLLANLDTVVRHPPVLDYVLGLSASRFGLPRPALVKFMEGVAPRVVEFGRLLDRDVRDCPNFAEALSAGGRELVNLAVETSRTRLGVASGVRPSHPTLAGPDPDAAATMVASARAAGGSQPVPTPAPRLRAGLPEFHPGFLRALPAGGCRVGEYELREVVGRGAMGVVFKAFEPGLGRFVAVKLLAPQLAADPEYRERFAREARLAAAVRHENVVAVHAVGEAGGLPYLATEYVGGGSLERAVEAGFLPVPDAVRVAGQVAAGLAAAHAKGIVHRDVKPANVLLEADTGRAKLTDFGLARAADDARLSRDGDLIGTPHYMAPEQVNGKPATAASDLFSLGALLYVLFTGRPPFPDEGLAAVLRALCFDEPEPPRRLRPDLPAWVEAVVLRLLRKDPAGRYASADEVAAALAAGGAG